MVWEAVRTARKRGENGTFVDGLAVKPPKSCRLGTTSYQHISPPKSSLDGKRVHGRGTALTSGIWEEAPKSVDSQVPISKVVGVDKRDKTPLSEVTSGEVFI